MFSAPSSGKIFGGTGGGLFSTSSSLFSPAPRTTSSETPAAAAGPKDAEDDDDGDLVEEEVTIVPGWTPSVTMEVKDNIETGEETEEKLYEQRSKLYRWKGGEWKERGLGNSRLMKDKATGRVRFLLRQEKTGKVVANHYIIQHKTFCNLKPNKESDKIVVWTMQDFADGEPAVETFGLKFGSSEFADNFKKAFDDAKNENAQLQEKEAEEKKEVAAKSTEA